MAEELSDNDIFDSIVSGKTVEAAEPVAIQQEPTPQPAQPRDDAGRFAAQQEQPAPVAEKPSAEPVNNASEQPASNGGNVPVGAVQAEREKRQEAQRENAELQRRIASLEGQIGLLSQQRQPAQQPQQEQAPASIFEDPDTFMKNQLTPFQKQMQEMREELWESRAAVLHTQEAVDAAKEAANALANTPQGKALHQQITAGGNPFDNLVKWHKQQQAFARVGNDPDAWLNAEIEKRKQDPAFQAQVLELARASAASNPAASRSSPLTNLPPSLRSIPSGGNVAGSEGAPSDEALFNSTTASRRG